MKGEISSVSRLPRHSHPGASFQSSAHRYKNILQPYQREKIGAHPHRQENLGSQVLPCLASSSHSTAAFWASFRALAGGEFVRRIPRRTLENLLAVCVPSDARFELKRYDFLPFDLLLDVYPFYRPFDGKKGGI